MSRAASLAIAFLGLLVSSAEAAPRVKPGRDVLASRVSQILAAGGAALKARDFPSARTAFYEAYIAQQSPEILCELGALSAAQGQILDAQDLFRRCLAETGGEKPAPAERLEEAHQILGQPRAASGEVLVSSRRGALVRVDDRLVGVVPLGAPLLLSLGRHVITVQSGGATLRGPVNVLSGRTVELQFSQEGKAILSRLLPTLMFLSDYSAIPVADAAKLSRAAEEAIQREHWAVLGSATALSQVPKLEACLTTARCPSELAAPLGAEYIIQSRITVAGEPGAWQLRLVLIDTEIGDVALSLSRSCPACNGVRAASLLAESLGKLLVDGTTRPRGTLAVSSTPPGAEVLLDGRSVGTTPYRHPLFAGRYAIALKKPGYTPAETRVVVESGKTALAELPLTLAAGQVEPAVPMPSEPTLIRKPRPRWRLIAGSLGLASGVLFIGFGASALAVNGACIEPPGVGECPDLYGTRKVGAGLLSVGVLLSLSGAALIAIPGRQGAAEAEKKERRHGCKLETGC